MTILSGVLEYKFFLIVAPDALVWVAQTSSLGPLWSLLGSSAGTGRGSSSRGCGGQRFLWLAVMFLESYEEGRRLLEGDKAGTVE